MPGWKRKAVFGRLGNVTYSPDEVLLLCPLAVRARGVGAKTAPRDLLMLEPWVAHGEIGSVCPGE
jgi:hypothetical protein